MSLVRRLDAPSETLSGDAARRQGVTLTIGLALCSAVSLLSSQALLVMFAGALAALAVADWRAARAAADSTLVAAFALASATVALLLAVYGYRPVPASVVDFHDLASLGPLTGSTGVTVRERAATASWPAGHFFELRFADRAQALGATLGALPASRYRATLVMTAAPGYGRAEVHLGAQGMTIDGRRGDGRAVPRWISFGEITLDAHSRLLVRALDSAGARIGLSGLVLEPVPSS